MMVNASLLDRPAMVLVMRGLTPEFHRPLREAVLRLYGDGSDSHRLVRFIIGPTLERMSIRPTEMEPEAFFRRFQSNPKAWSTAFISYADRCRLLPSLCQRIVEHGNREGARIAKAFLGWDTALSGTLSSDWRQSAK
jgi:hypothetical protein